MPPKPSNGKICYLEVPAIDIVRSAEFYKQVFGWNIRQRGDGATAFDDTTGEVSGAFVRNRPPSLDPGLLVYIMVDSVADTLHRVDPALVKQEVTSAGFKFVSESHVLHNPGDDHSAKVFTMVDKTDRFLFKFRKPRG